MEIEKVAQVIAEALVAKKSSGDAADKAAKIAQKYEEIMSSFALAKGSPRRTPQFAVSKGIVEETVKSVLGSVLPIYIETFVSHCGYSLKWGQGNSFTIELLHSYRRLSG